MGNWEVSVHVLISFFCIALTAGDWNYEDTKKWEDDYPTCKDTNIYQSPIRLSNFYPDQLDYDLYRTGLTKYMNGIIINTGKFLEILLDLRPEKSTPSVTLKIGDERSEYFIDGIQFHWPAEHIINGKRNDLEMQVHYIDSDTNKTLIVSNVYQECNETDMVGIEMIGGVLRNFSKAPEWEDIQMISLNQFSDTDCGMYMYNGSLTTPPCTVGVTWIVYDEALCISPEEIASFKNLKDVDGENIKPNSRPSFSQQGRKMYYTPC